MWAKASHGRRGSGVADARPIAAAARVLEDVGWQNLTVEAVAEAAGLSWVTALAERLARGAGRGLVRGRHRRWVAHAARR